MKNNHPITKMEIKLNPDDWHGLVRETLFVTELGSNRYRLENTPFLAKGVSNGDEVAAVHSKRGLVFSKVLKHSGHSTFRILVEESVTPTEFQQQWLKLERLGCTCEDVEGDIPLFSVDVPPNVTLEKVLSILDEGHERGIWTYEEGHIGHPQSAAK
ncbi:DUF4265 domain-containing protein [Pseudovibrio sp. SPO723]|uniref:DUF4265 domain-containing protein n=1 Tax=Nesiotobacter zosterae TaxID=392721 RepID=UPI0029C110C2|nr:DUF4265 domain-containing protein [Pseudovibrio sp. SPO723]MDX5592388.1 DUF4265 domain-containing protein [Pseudovibrio sp. SPO723]